jgi:LPS export ABC transporter protein LptC
MRGAGWVAAAFAAGLVGLFLVQSGVLEEEAAQKSDAPPVVKYPDQVSSDNATINGLDRNQRRFEIRADAGQQDKTIKTLVHMQGVAGNFERNGGGRMDIAAKAAKYDSKTKALELEGDVSFVEGSRMKAVMDRAEVNTDDQSLRSLSPVKVDMQGSTIMADSLTVDGNGGRILFKGGVKARFMTKAPPTGDGG